MLRGPGESQASAVRAGCGPNHRPLASADPWETSRVIDILFQLVYYVINLFKWAVILAAIFSLLTAFGVLDTRNRIVWTIGDFLYRVTEPVLRPIRNMLPNLGGIDLSPWIVVVLIQIVILPLLSKLHAAITYGALATAGTLTMFWRPLADGVAVAVKVQPKSRRPGVHGPCPISRRRAPAHRRHRARGGRSCQPRRLRRTGRGARIWHRPRCVSRSARPAARRPCTSPAIPPRLARSWPRCDARASSTARRSLPRCGRGSPGRSPRCRFVPASRWCWWATIPRARSTCAPRTARRVPPGSLARTIRLPADVSEEALIAEIARLNADPAVDGILVQLPLPAHIVSQAAIEAIDPDKDVDGFHPLNVGRLVTRLPAGWFPARRPA